MRRTNVFLIISEHVSPNLSFPLIEIILCLITLSITFSIFINSLCAKLSQSFVDLLSNLIKLFIRAITKAKHCVAYTFKQLVVVCLVFPGLTEPLVEFFHVVTGVTFVMCSCANYHEWLLSECFLFKFFKVNSLGWSLSLLCCEYGLRLLF